MLLVRPALVNTEGNYELNTMKATAGYMHSQRAVTSIVRNIYTTYISHTHTNIYIHIYIYIYKYHSVPCSGTKRTTVHTHTPLEQLISNKPSCQKRQNPEYHNHSTCNRTPRHIHTSLSWTLIFRHASK